MLKNKIWREWAAPLGANMIHADATIITILI